MHVSRVVSLSVVLLAILYGPTSAHAQRRLRSPNKKKENFQEQQVKLNRYKIEGKITGVLPDRIRVETKNSQAPVVIVWLDQERTKLVLVKGKADEAFLRSGVVVRFAAHVDRRGNPTEPIKKITIFEPTAESTAGIFPQDPADSEGLYDIFGTIKSLKQKRLTVVCGKNQVRATLAEKPEVHIEVSDHSLAQEGDAVKIIAWGETPAEVAAEEIRITLSATVSAPQKRGRRAPATQRSSDKRKS